MAQGKRDLQRERFEVFAHEYVKDFNGTRAAIAAGCKPRSAHVTASRWLKNAKVKAIIAEVQKKQCDKLEVTAERVLSELAKLSYSNMLDYVKVGADGQLDTDFSAITREQAAAIQEIKCDTTGGTGDGERRQVLRTTFKLADKGANLERLGRHLKLFTDVVKHEGLEGLSEKLAEIRKRKSAKI